MIGKLRQLTLVLAVCGAVLVAIPLHALAADTNVQTEDQAIAALKGNGGWQEKYEACIRLRQIGTVKSVPALVPLLKDEHLSHMARYAMERMPYPEVDKALRKAVAKTSGPQKTGILISIGARRDAASESVVARALNDHNPNVVRAAAGALGRIGTPDAAKSLLKAADTAPASVKPALAEGLLAAGEQLAHKGDARDAETIYAILSKEPWPKDTRMGAVRGMALADPAKTPARLLAVLGGNDSEMRNMAAQLVADTKESTASYTAGMAKLPPAGQAALLRGLEGRKDAAARPAVLDAMKSSDAQIQVAAVKAMETLGAPENVATVAALLVSSNADVAAAAKTALAAMGGKEIDAAIAAAAPSATPEVRAQLISILTERMAAPAKSLAATGLQDSAKPVRIASLQSLARIGGKEEAAPVIAVLKATNDASEREEAAASLGAICSVAGDEVLPTLLDALKGAKTESRLVLLRSLGRIGTAKALDPIVAAIDDRNAEISDTALRVLANWPNAEAAPHLLKLTSSKDSNRRDLGLRGYVRLAQAEASPDKKADMLATAMKIAKRPEDKWLVLGAWGTLHTKNSLAFLLPYLKDPAVQKEAAIAIIAVADELSDTPETAPDAKAALQTVLDQCKDQAIRDRAQKTLAGIKG